MTGVTGYIGYQTLVLALRRGYRVRAVIRKQTSLIDLKRNPIVADGLNQGRLDVVVLPDFLENDAFLRHLQGITTIIHLASPLSFSVIYNSGLITCLVLTLLYQATDFLEGIVKPAVDMVTNVLDAANRTPSIRRVVLTSSCRKLSGKYFTQEADLNLRRDTHSLLMEYESRHGEAVHWYDLAIFH